MKPLLDLNSPLYLKRIVRELNSQQDGFYASIACHRVRCNRARYKKYEIEVHSFTCKPTWFNAVSYVFTDCYGRQIVASRTP